MEDIEHCWVLIGGRSGPLWHGRLKKLSSGTPTRVAFDFRSIQDREEKHGDIIGFYHTHPTFSAIPSGIDHNTMKAWVCSFGKPLICAIRGTDGLRIYEYIDDESAPLELLYFKGMGNLMFGVSSANDEYLDEDEALEDDPLDPPTDHEMKQFFQAELPKSHPG